MKKIFVTGAEGFLGNNLVRILLKQGYNVSVLKRPGPSTDFLDLLDVNQEIGDLLEPKRLIRLTRGMDAIIHVAAVTDPWPTRSPNCWKVNFEGTRNIVDACKVNQIPRLVHCSTASVFQHGTQANPGTEDRMAGTGTLDYIDSKMAAHQLVEQAARIGDVFAVIVCPTFMIGPWDIKPTSGAFLINAVKEKLPALAAGGKNWVHVQDVAMAATHALTMGRNGEAYLCGHLNMEYRQALEIISDISGCNIPRLKIPDAAFKALGWMSEKLATTFGYTPRLSYQMARIATEGRYYQSDKAIQELHLPQTSLHQAFEESYQWFKHHHYL